MSAVAARRFGNGGQDGGTVSGGESRDGRAMQHGSSRPVIDVCNCGQHGCEFGGDLRRAMKPQQRAGAQ